jgi:hypothetical protein
VPLVTNVLLGADPEKKRRIFVWSVKDANFRNPHFHIPKFGISEGSLFFWGQPNIQRIICSIPMANLGT